jgi:hypothetical protein
MYNLDSCADLPLSAQKAVGLVTPPRDVDQEIKSLCSMVENHYISFEIWTPRVMNMMRLERRPTTFSTWARHSSLTLWSNIKEMLRTSDRTPCSSFIEIFRIVHIDCMLQPNNCKDIKHRIEEGRRRHCNTDIERVHRYSGGAMRRETTSRALLVYL